MFRILNLLEEFEFVIFLCPYENILSGPQFGFFQNRVGSCSCIKMALMAWRYSHWSCFPYESIMCRMRILVKFPKKNKQFSTKIHRVFPTEIIWYFIFFNFRILFLKKNSKNRVDFQTISHTNLHKEYSENKKERTLRIF